MVKTTYSGGLTLTYAYSGEGYLYSVTAARGSDSTKYIYTYDANGRVIASERQDGGASVLRTRQSYDSVNRLAGQIWQIGEDAFSESYTYNSTIDGSLNTMTLKDGSATIDLLTMGYDGLRRLSSVTGSVYSKSYTYRDISSTQTTTQIASVSYDLPVDQTFAYTYDVMGNIAAYTDANGTVEYTYDPQGQLLSASNGYSYTYDSVGNILTGNGHSYTYGDTQGWADLLTAVDGQTITYDNIGNPTSYYNGTRWAFTWEQGRQLATASDGTNSISYTYDADGLRTSKTVNGTKHTYYYAGGKLLRETYGTNTLDFFYDANGNAHALKYDRTLYYYITNLQGDVMSIVDGSGNVVASYQYDPYGNVITATGELAETNPLRYRGYYYDTESTLYYLQSRYYDPELGRFLNADAYASTGQGILGNNMFAYCGNNPVVYYDPAGNERISFHYNQFDRHSGSDGGGGVGVGIATGYILYPLYLLAKEAAEILVEGLQEIYVSATPPQGDYTVYFLCAQGDTSKTIIYVGRVKTKNFDSRMSYHSKMGRQFVDSISNLSYEACRAIEQGGMMYYHTINRDSALKNKIRGIGASNSNRHLYLALIQEMINRNLYPANTLLPLSYWDNLSENEFLNLAS